MEDRLTELREKRDRYLTNIAYFFHIIEDLDRDIEKEEERKKLKYGKTVPRSRR